MLAVLRPKRSKAPRELWSVGSMTHTARLSVLSRDSFYIGRPALTEVQRTMGMASSSWGCAHANKSVSHDGVLSAATCIHGKARAGPTAAQRLQFARGGTVLIKGDC